MNLFFTYIYIGGLGVFITLSVLTWLAAHKFFGKTAPSVEPADTAKSKCGVLNVRRPDCVENCMKREYEIGDTCWIVAGNCELCEGRVVQSFTMADCPTTFYIIKMAGDEFLHLEVRDAYLMSPSADQLPPINVIEDKPETHPIGL